MDFFSFIEKLKFGFEYSLDNLIKFTKKNTEFLLNYTFVKSQPYIINCLLLYSKTNIVIKQNIDFIYNSNPVVKNTFNNIYYGVNYLYNKLNGKKNEPYDDFWISSSLLNIKNVNEYIFCEKYNFYDNIIDKLILYEKDGLKNEMKDDLLFNMFDYYYNRSLFIFNDPSKKTIESMTIMKYSNKYIVYNIFTDSNKNSKEYITNNNFKIKYPLVDCEIKFLSISYTHPKMSGSVEINLSDDYFLVNNTLLSPLFIKRYLEYNFSPDSYYFDMNYKIILIDDSINTVELNSNNYILLSGKNSYDIKVIVP